MSVAAINAAPNIHLLPDPVLPSAVPAAVSPPVSFPPLKRISELECIPADDCSYLLSNRLLRRGESAGLVGPSGLGKSTTAVQMAIQWSAGLPALGLAPLAPMRVIMMQSENDEAEMSMLTRGILRVADFTAEQAAMVDENFVMAEVSGGEHLLAMVEHYVREHDADLLIIDPVMAYYAGEISSASEFGGFLRTLAAQFKRLNVAVMFVHHAGKKKTTPGGAAIDIDAIYGGIGSSEFSNVPRVIFTLDQHREAGFARLKIGKRAKRSPWVDAEGQRVSEITLEPSGDPETPFWQRSTMEAMLLRPQQPAVDRMAAARAAILRALQGSAQTEQGALEARVHTVGVSRDSFREARIQLYVEGAIMPVECPRPGTRPAIHWQLAPPAVAPGDDTAAVITENNPPPDGGGDRSI